MSWHEEREAAAINAAIARIQDHCPGRLHRRHMLATCTGSCCTACGGPIDDDSECRCETGRSQEQR